jgi:hypothetical protein
MHMGFGSFFASPVCRTTGGLEFGFLLLFTAFSFSSLELLSSDEWNACMIRHDSPPGMIRLTIEYITVDIRDENASPLSCCLPILLLSSHSS